MKVCIGITTKNRRGILPKAIESALSQDYPESIVFVYDDCSDDGTSELRTLYPTIKWERGSESIGLLEARNHMMRTCGADIFVSLDDDAWFLKGDEVRKAVQYFADNPVLAGVAFDILEAQTDRFNVVSRGKPVPTNFFMGAGHALRLSAVKEVGYYTPFPVRYGHEEKDLGIRLLNAGYQIWFVPGVHVWHDYTPVERNLEAQDRGFMINDLIFKFRRVPLLYLLPVLGISLKRTLNGEVRNRSNTKEAVKTFFKLIPSQLKTVSRVSLKTYKNYLNLSKSYLAYRSENKQHSES